MVDNEVRLKLLKELRETNFAAYTTKYGEKAGFFFAAALPRECHIAELEQENAELKVLLDCKNCSELSEEECEVCAEASHFKCKGKDQLAKAIGIIKRWYETNRSACIEPSQELIEVTEQFLKDSEVEKWQKNLQKD